MLLKKVTVNGRVFCIPPMDSGSCVALKGGKHERATWILQAYVVELQPKITSYHKVTSDGVMCTVYLFLNPLFVYILLQKNEMIANPVGNLSKHPDLVKMATNPEVSSEPPRPSYRRHFLLGSNNRDVLGVWWCMNSRRNDPISIHIIPC